jgi:hypothetical protein
MDEQLFSDATRQLRLTVGTYLVAFYGERCADFEPNCEVCKRWQALDVICPPTTNQPKDA